MAKQFSTKGKLLLSTLSTRDAHGMQETKKVIGAGANLFYLIVPFWFFSMYNGSLRLSNGHFTAV